MTHTTTDPLADQVVRQAQLISQLRHDLNQLASEITDAYADLVSRIEGIDATSTTGARSAAAWCWRDLGPEAATELEAELDNWVSWLRHRYPLAKKVPPCWAEHPEVVEEVTALWLAWQAAYQDTDSSLTTAADWHDRWLPGLLHRLEHGPHAINCSTIHQPRPDAAYA